MANIYKALPHFLIADGPLNALVGSKIYPLRIPQSTDLPVITFQDVSTAVTQAHGEPSALPRKRFQFTIHGGTNESTDTIAKALKTRLDGYRGTMGEGLFLTEVTAVLFKNDIPDDDTETGIMRRLLDFVIQYKE